LSYFLYSSLVSLPLLASLKEKSIYGEFDFFLEAKNKNDLEGDNLADEAIRDRFALF